MITVISTADTDVLALHVALDRHLPDDFDGLAAGPLPDGVPDLSGTDVLVVRLLGGRRVWGAFDAARQACIDADIPFIAVSGEAAVDAELTAASTVPAPVVAEVHAYLTAGGIDNAAACMAFLSDTLLRTGHGFDPPVEHPMTGLYGDPAIDPDRPTVGIVFYRSHFLAGNTGFIDALREAIEGHGANPVCVWTYSLRPEPDGSVPALDLLATHDIDALLVGMFAMGGTAGTQPRPQPVEDTTGPQTGVSGDAAMSMGEWAADALARLDVPVVQAIAATSTRQEWLDGDRGLSPLDTAMYVALPEFDGRIISVPTSFKEVGEAGTAYAADPERSARAAGIAVRLARLRHTPAADRKVALVLSNYPTKHSRIGNAVGLDTPASAVRLLDALTAAGYDTGTWGEEGLDGDALIHRLIAAGGFDEEFLTEAQLSAQPARVAGSTYREWFDGLPEDLRDMVTDQWGPPPGEVLRDGDDLVFAVQSFGNVTLAVQPPRGFGEDPVAIYHDPDLAPTHHYVAFYRWLDAPGPDGRGHDAVVHMGKHGTLEWMPGKGVGLSASCAPDGILGDLPFVYPFVVNDPGEGTQAKRRGHAVVVDHMVPPMTRAETYDELTQLEQLLDEYYHVDAMDPAKVAAIQGEIWQLLRSAELTRDLKLTDRGDAVPDDLDDLIVGVDGYLCEIKDAQIRGGLHILGQAPTGEERIGLVLAILRLSQAGLPGLRSAIAEAIGTDEAWLLDAPGARLDTPVEGTGGRTLATRSDVVDLLEDHARSMAEALEATGWDAAKVDAVIADVLGRDAPTVAQVLTFAATDVVPRLAGTACELTRIGDALAGRYIPAGPSGSPTRGRVDVLPTGKNFYSVDPKGLPSELAWQVGQRLAEDLVRRHVEEEGVPPTSVGIIVWGTAAMRTHGDDIAEILALLGVRPVWHRETRRVTGLELMTLEELGRPRVDVTVRISGFFRDAFPHLVELVDDAVAMVADATTESAADNPLAAHVAADVAAGTDRRAATARVFGSKPGAYGAGLLPLIDARNWQTDADLAEVYATWGGYAYGRGLDGADARGDMERAFSRIQVAVKNTDTREHDLLDSDDYFQYHGGMVTMVRHLTGRDPKAYVGDSHDPSRIRTRDLAEETARVFRARVANPKWIAAMQRHGYKGAFELSATVDYLFGYDATAGVVEDWMYQTLSESYVFDEGVRDFMEASNPWALRAITERLLEAADRGLWAEPDPDTLDALRTSYLEGEADLEGRADDAGRRG